MRFTSPNDLEITLAGTRYHIPGDGIYFHISLANSVAYQLKLPFDLVDWPHVPGYRVGAFGEAFGETNDYPGDIKALAKVQQDPQSEHTTQEWGGIYATRDVGYLYDEDGDLRDLSKEESYYLNVVAPNTLANEFHQKNPSVVLHDTDRKGLKKIIGGKYNYASKLSPPPRLSPIFREWKLKVAEPAAPVVKAEPAVTVQERPRMPGPSTGTPPKEQVTAAFRGKTGEKLKSRLESKKYVELAKRAEKSPRKVKLAKFNERSAELEEDTSIERVLDLIDEIAGGSGPMSAFLVRQIQQQFSVNYEDATVTHRSLLREEECSDSE